jgi:hypothetical protein
MGGETGAAALAVAGTLLGALVAGWHQFRMARAARRDALRDQGLKALSELVAALADHRRAMWVREELRLDGAEPSAVATAREASHQTRSAITAPQVAVMVLLPNLRAEVTQAVNAAYGMRRAADLNALREARESAVDAAEHLTTVAAGVLARI